MDEFDLMSRAERIAWCERRLRRYDEIEADILSTPNDPFRQQRTRQLADARRQIEDVLRMLRKPSLWQRVNMYVNREAAKDEAREAARARRPRPCPACRGSGKVQGAGRWFEPCRSCNSFRY
ncbi:hypothetical protein AB0B86_00445 [Micromonospora sp. NPDC049047]|uniref:hypothetical protein n=1 Tax=Micromonospora sp. NPDC049047 TaxID=3155645 RepID=UPI0034085E3A